MNQYSRIFIDNMVNIMDYNSVGWLIEHFNASLF